MCAVAAVFALKGKIFVALVPGSSYSGRTRANSNAGIPCCACMHAHVHVIIRHQRRISVADVVDIKKGGYPFGGVDSG